MKPLDSYLDIRVDFVEGAVGFRRSRSSLKSELLSRAVGAKKGLKVLDGTAGLGRDSFILASLGYEVTAVEKEEEIFKLFEDGLHRARENPETKDAALRIKLFHSDLAAFLKNNMERYDAIYLDPMFPEKSKSSLPKKEMQILQNYFAQKYPNGATSEESAIELLEVSLAQNTRVVVKRPLSGSPLKPAPLAQFKGRSVRFDVYKK